MIFNFFTTERVFRVAQYDGINDFVPFDLSGEKRPLVQFLVGEFHSSTICKRFDPLVAHSAPPNGDPVEIIRALRLKMCKTSSCGPWHIVNEIRRLHSKPQLAVKELSVYGAHVWLGRTPRAQGRKSTRCDSLKVRSTGAQRDRRNRHGAGAHPTRQPKAEAAKIGSGSCR